MVLLGGPAAGVVPARAPRKRCGPLTPGIWTGPKRPYTWRIDDDCAYRVSTPFDFLTAFAGKRLIFAGDSVSRELSWDLMRLLMGCGSFQGGKYTGPAPGFGATVGSQDEYAAGRCEAMRKGATAEAQWEDMQVRVPVGNTGLFVEIMFYWLQWPSQLYGSDWFNATILTGDFDALILNSYLHIRFNPTPTRSWYDKEIAELIDVLLHQPAANVTKKLRQRVFWRQTLPLELYKFEVDSYRPPNVSAAAVATSDQWRAAGFPVIVLDKYLRHATCTANETVRFCVTGDGIHGIFSTNLVINREMLSVIADTIDAETPESR